MCRQAKDKHDKDKLADIDWRLDDVLRTLHGQTLKEIRDAHGMTQVELAEQLGYSRSVIANAETGTAISRDFLDRMLREFPEEADLLQTIEPTSKRQRVAALREDDLESMFLNRANKTTDLDGTWFALWESTAEHEEVVNSEELHAKMKRNGSLLLQNVEVSAENPKGGYLWVATCRVFDNQYVLGTYIAREPNVRSKGCLYLVIHRSGRFISGQWLGCNYDGDWARGLVVLGREREPLPELLVKHRDELPALPYPSAQERKGAR